jgi:hypothetical protein
MVFFGFPRPCCMGFNSDVSVRSNLSFFKVGESGSGGCPVTGRKKICRSATQSSETLDNVVKNTVS